MCNPSFISAGSVSGAGGALRPSTPRRTVRPVRGVRDPISRLRDAIECLPVETCEAMLDGIRRNPTIIVGAYTDGRGGVCPMLAAHRNGSRVSFLGFARAWDAYSRARS